MEEHKKKHHKHSASPSEEINLGSPAVEEKKAEGSEIKEIEDLKRRLDEKEKEAKDHYDRFLRLAADLDNYKKRAAREKEEWVKFAHEDLLKAILPLIDNLERAVNHSEKAKDIQGLIEGVKLTIQTLIQTLSKFGVSPIESIGKPFDPTLHEAMMVVETNEHEPHHVMEEFQRGYLLNDRLLRPATVSVSKLLEREAPKA